MRSTATSPSRSSSGATAAGLRHCTLIADLGDARAAAFAEALARHGLPPALRVDYREVLARGAASLDRVPSRSFVRLETPGRAADIQEALLRLGGAPVAIRENARIVYSQAWYAGLTKVLEEIGGALRGRRVRYTSHPADVAVVFDKRRCHRHLAAAGIPVAPALGPVRSFDELRECMTSSRRSRVFVKLNYGSSASGVIAYETSPRGEQAFTTVDTDLGALYNTRRVRRIGDRREIAALVDALCRHDVHVEAWVPKAGLDGRRFDLRVVTIAGEPAHLVVRSSSKPMTNLHLMNARGSAEGIRARMGEAAWERVMATAQRVAKAFPRSLHLGLDVAITPGFRSHAVLEVNAFGDWLKGVLHEGRTTHEHELRAVFGDGAAP